MTGIGVAISTTGDPHRLKFLETCVRRWCDLPDVSHLFVTVDGDPEAVARVAKAVDYWTGSVYRVGQRDDTILHTAPVRNGRLGVAANKNTGLELLMDQTSAQHLFLCDDDSYPLNECALELHTGLDLPHSMVCWGRNRKPVVRSFDRDHAYATWSWPRGVCLYQTRAVVARVGGMDETFGPGGHEHVEYSRRIHQAGLTPEPFVSPTAYARTGMGASAYWHCEDMPLPGENQSMYQRRKNVITSIHREVGDWDHINSVMAARDGDTSFVPFRAHENGRASATLAGILNEPTEVSPDHIAVAKEPGSQG